MRAMASWLLLLMVPLGIGALLPRNYRSSPFQWWDLPFSFLLAMVSTVAAAVYFSKFHLTGSPFSQSDFSQYCEVVDAARRHLRDTDSPHRSWLVGVLLSPIVEVWGIRDGLAMGSAIATTLVGVGLYLWGFAVGGRMAALLSVLLLPAVPCLTLLPRMLSFYPEFCGIVALVCGSTAMAIRLQNSRWVLTAASMVGIAMLIDLKALLWILLPLLAIFIVAAIETTVKRALLRVLAVAAILTLSWKLGSWVWPSDMGGTLEGQMSSYVGDIIQRNTGDEHGRQIASDPAVCGFSPTLGFRWGTGSPLDIPRTLNCLRKLQALIPEKVLENSWILERKAYYVTPLFPWVGICGLISMVGLGFQAVQRKTLLRLAALLVPLPPMLLSLQAAAAQEADPRRLVTSLLFLPVFTGVFFTILFRWQGGAVTERLPMPRWSKRVLKPWALNLILVGMVELFLFGILPSFLSPAASWRVPFLSEQEKVLYGIANTGKDDQNCVSAIQRDLAEGQPNLSRFEGWYGAVPSAKPGGK